MSVHMHHRISLKFERSESAHTSYEPPLHQSCVFVPAEILVKGKMLGEAAKLFSQPHRFEKFTYTTPAYCDYCSHVLWGLVKTGEAGSGIDTAVLCHQCAVCCSCS